jgi:hypothetical protein
MGGGGSVVVNGNNNLIESNSACPGVTKMDDPQLGALTAANCAMSGCRTPVRPISAGSYRDDEAPASFQPSLGSACFIRRAVTNQNFRVVPGPLTTFLKDRHGYVKFNLTSPAVGLILSRQGAAGAGQHRFAGIRALHKTAATATALRLPVFPPFCD